MPLHRFAPRRCGQGLACLALAASLVTACGKKGPPLAPFSSVPASPPEVSIRRKGDQVEIRFKVPGVNSDGRGPADIDRVKVFALTTPGKGILPPLFLKHATPVNEGLLVREPPPPPPDVKEGDPPPPPPPPRTDPGLDQGEPAIIVDQLTTESFVPADLPELDRQKKADEEAARKHPTRPPIVAPPDLGPPVAVPVLRYYAVAGLNGKRKGVMSALVPVPVDEAPPVPSAPTVTVAEGRVDVKWTAPEGLRQPVIKVTLPPTGAPAGQPAPVTPVAPVEPSDEDESPPEENPPATEPPPTAGTMAAPVTAAPVTVPPATATPVLPAAQTATGESPASQQPSARTLPAGVASETEGAQGQVPAAGTADSDHEPKRLPARPLMPFPTTLYAYAVYETAPTGFTALVQQPGAVPPYPVLLTPTPVMTLTWSDARFVVGVERCYALRTVATTGTLTLESALSPPTCVKTNDVFAPGAPKNLAAVASEGAINLIWEANTETDLAGYIVLRAVADGSKLSPITPTPIKETTFRDTRVKAGIRYAYVVVAVDAATPQNVSPQSNRVEETAR